MSDFYDNYKELMLGAGTHTLGNLSTGDIRFVCTDHADVAAGAGPSLTTHLDLADISAGTVATSAALAGKSITDGTFDHTDETLGTVTGDQFESLTYYVHSGTPANDALICLIDSGTGLPFTPSGGDIIVRPNASGVFSL